MGKLAYIFHPTYVTFNLYLQDYWPGDTLLALCRYILCSGFIHISMVFILAGLYLCIQVFSVKTNSACFVFVFSIIVIFLQLMKCLALY